MDKQSVVERAIEVWQPHYLEPLSQSDGVEIVETMTAYFNLISKWVRDGEHLRRAA